MSLQSAADIPLLITSTNAASERRISPSWTLAQFKTRLEPITGIPSSAQRLTLRIASQEPAPIDAADEEKTQLASFALQPHAEIYVDDTRPPSLRTDFTDVSSVQKYEMPPEEYEARSDSVLAWKKAQKLGRFDPNAPDVEEQKRRAAQREVEERGITDGARCRLLPLSSDDRRGKVAFIGSIPELPGVKDAPWVGVRLDEPTGKNDGSVQGKRYFECPRNCGVFLRPERVEVGDFPPLDDVGEEMEEI